MTSRAVAAPATRRLPPAVQLVLVLVLAAGCVLLQAPRATAHADLAAASPGPGERVALAPFRVTLVFTEGISPQSVQVVVKGPDGAPAHGAVTVRDATVTVPVLTTDPGRYAVAYRVTSVDGHPVVGRYTYAVDGPDEQARTVAVEDSTPATGTATGAAPETAGAAWWWLLVVAPVFLARVVQRGRVRRSGRLRAVDDGEPAGHR